MFSPIIKLKSLSLRKTFASVFIRKVSKNHIHLVARSYVYILSSYLLSVERKTDENEYGNREQCSYNIVQHSSICTQILLMRLLCFFDLISL